MKSYEDLQFAIQIVESNINDIKTEEELTEMLSILQTALNDLTEIDQESSLEDFDEGDNNKQEKPNTGEKQPGTENGEENPEQAKPLPNTATTMYTSLLIGFALLIIAGVTFAIYRKKRLSNKQ